MVERKVMRVEFRIKLRGKEVEKKYEVKIKLSQLLNAVAK
jgi:hypothetical protein